MPIVQHNSKYRRTWMFPRNIRHIAPWKLSQIVALLSEQTRYSSWSGNQQVQNQFTKALELAGLKRDGDQYDSHSGGARTYLAQLGCIGLTFKRKNGQLYLTMAGEEMAKGAPPLPILQELLFRHQYPSVYSCNQNVKIHPSIKVKPFLFVLELMARAGHLTHDELVIPMVYGHNHACLDLCLEKIGRMRDGASLASMIDSPDDLYTPRTRKRNKTAALADVKDIANTCKNYLYAGCLIDVEVINRKHQMNISAEYSDIISRAITHNKDFITAWKSEEAFQRRFGCWGRTKDTRLVTDTVSDSPAKGIIAAHFFRLAGTEPIFTYPDEFIDEMTSGFGFVREVVEETIDPLLAKALSYFEATYMDLAKSGGAKAMEFEKATGSLFADRLKFKVEQTGQKRRVGNVGGYSDLFLIALDDFHCAVIDTKSTSAYSLNAPDYRAMAHDYIPSYMELSPGKNRNLEFCSYVAGGFSGNIEGKLKMLKTETGIPVSAISALNLLRVCNAEFNQEEIRSVFSTGRKLNYNDFSTGNKSA